MIFKYLNYIPDYYSSMIFMFMIQYRLLSHFKSYNKSVFFLWALKGLTFLCFSWFQHCRICYDHRLQYNQGCMLILSYTFNPFWCHQLIFPTTNLSTFIWRYVPIRTCAVVRITRTLTWTIMSFVSVYTLPKNTFLHKIHKFWSL